MLPYVGPTIVFLTGAILSLTQGFNFFIAFIIVFAIVEGLISNLILPRIVGDKIKVPPVIITLMIVIGAQFLDHLAFLLQPPLF